MELAVKIVRPTVKRIIWRKRSNAEAVEYKREITKENQVKRFLGFGTKRKRDLPARTHTENGTRVHVDTAGDLQAFQFDRIFRSGNPCKTVGPGISPEDVYEFIVADPNGLPVYLCDAQTDKGNIKRGFRVTRYVRAWYKLVIMGE